MLWMIYTTSLIGWLMLMVSDQTYGGWVHVLLALALTCLIIRIYKEYENESN